MAYRDPNLYPGTGRTATLRYNVTHAIHEVVTKIDKISGYDLADAANEIHQFVTDDTGSAAYVAFNLNMADAVAEILRRIGYDAKDIGHSNLRVEFR